MVLVRFELGGVQLSSSCRVITSACYFDAYGPSDDTCSGGPSVSWCKRRERERESAKQLDYSPIMAANAGKRSPMERRTRHLRDLLLEWAPMSAG